MVLDNPGRETEFLAQMQALRQQEEAKLESAARTSWVARRRLIARLESELEGLTELRVALERRGAGSADLADIDRDIRTVRQRMDRFK